MTKPIMQIFAQVKEGGRWKTVDYLETDQKGFSCLWFKNLLRRYRPKRPKMRLLSRLIYK